jgi:dynein heavy chain
VLYIYYREVLLFQAAREAWSKTLWTNLNSEVLLSGMEHFMSEFRCFDDVVKRLPVGQVVYSRMEEFRNSVPLLVELKNDALRERHWQELMEKTGSCQSP